MPVTPTPVPLAQRYFARGITRVVYVPTMDSYTAPTQSEVSAGTDLSEDVFGMTGFAISTAAINTPSMGSAFTGKIAGEETAADSSLTMYASADGEDASTVFSRGDSGFMVFLDAGLSSTICSVYPCQVGSLQRVRSDSAASNLIVSFFLTRPPAENVALAA